MLEALIKAYLTEVGCVENENGYWSHPSLGGSRMFEPCLEWVIGCEKTGRNLAAEASEATTTLLCENCGKSMAEHDGTHCYPASGDVTDEMVAAACDAYVAEPESDWETNIRVAITAALAARKDNA